jgi:hypothetical protein
MRDGFPQAAHVVIVVCCFCNCIGVGPLGQRDKYKTEKTGWALRTFAPLRTVELRESRKTQRRHERLLSRIECP